MKKQPGSEYIMRKAPTEFWEDDFGASAYSACEDSRPLLGAA